MSKAPNTKSFETESHFGDAVIECARSLGHCFCLGLDPHLSMIPEAFRAGDMHPGNPATVSATEKFLLEVIDRTSHRVVAYKPQSAMYEAMGSAGINLLERLVAYIHERGGLVLLDAKRGDIAATAEAYARAYLAPDSPNPVDALTVNPYMGLDTIEPYLDLSRKHGKGVYVVLRTSNPGAGAFQDLRSEGGTVYEVIAENLRPLTEDLCGAQTGWSSLGVVVGATAPAESAKIREILPKALYLLPGYGYQKGDITRITSALVPGPSKLEGGLISSSRATLFPQGEHDSPYQKWTAAFTDQLERHIKAVEDIL
ncbi:orotidine-5'-phosphate decarboxylase [Roseibium marinum]|uniref:Orotidine 5'-phosphate decarboxylase n=1 Tax=Roseibium marinum TaxID=281252 RepID=A0A2S3UY91_9HYPH|nr:orotidine-5'-phosphate decarboxylase [Roseibium marinum]POF32691.1 orotidine-5'-phosphate decarboxylase [Roseibium marinum]